jgi:hypothetical protein
MALLNKDTIIDLYCVVDDMLQQEHRGGRGRPQSLNNSEIVTILLWHSLIQNDKTLKEMYQNLKRYHHNDFPTLPSYTTFVRRSHECFSELYYVLQYFLNDTASARILDSTMLPVCKLARADSHKVAKNIAKFGKNWQGWHYGFKLHTSIDLEGKLCGFTFTSANIHDIHGMQYILNKYCDIAVGDTLYGAKVMGRKMYEMFGTTIVAPPHPAQKRKIVTQFQNELLNLRSKIESTFDILKEHMHLVSSFPRSVKGYFLHYVRILLGYQLSHL